MIIKNKSCRICSNSNNNGYYSATEMMYGLKGTFDYFQCNKCNCLQIEEIIDDMSKYYPTDYYSFNKYEGKEFKGLKGFIRKKRYEYTIFQKNAFQNLILSLLGKKGYDVFSDTTISLNSKILDIGCGNGEHFLYPLSEIGFKNLLGCDPFINNDINYKNGLLIKKTDVLTIKGSFDFITYHHAFEHLSNPFENLKKVNELLSHNGICVLRIPTVSSYAWKHYKTNWVQLDAPRHFFLHSTESIKILAEKAGLELFKIEYDSNYFQFAGSEMYKKGISLNQRSNPTVKKLWKKNRKAYNRKSKELNKQNLGDQAAFFLRRKS